MRTFKTIAAIALLFCTTNTLTLAQNKPRTVSSLLNSSGSTPSIQVIECVPARTEAERGAEAKMTMLVTVTFKDTPFNEALTALAKIAETPIRFPLLENIGSDGDEFKALKINVTFKAMPLKTVLHRIIKSALNDDYEHWIESGARITIAPTINGLELGLSGAEASAYAHSTTRIYPVKDLCSEREDAEEVVELILSSTGTMWKDISSKGQPGIRYLGALMTAEQDDDVLQMARYAGSVTYLHSIPGLVVKTDAATHYEVLSLLRMIRKARLAAATQTTAPTHERFSKPKETKLMSRPHPDFSQAHGKSKQQPQVLFVKPEGMQVASASQSTRNSQPHLLVPARKNYSVGQHLLELTNIPGRKGLELFPTLDIRQPTKRTQAYLDHNAIPIQLTEEDFDGVTVGHLVTKVTYLPDPEFQELALAGCETLVSTLLDPGVDPITEAERRGEILAVLQVGNRKRATTQDVPQKNSLSHKYSNSYHVFTNAYKTTEDGVTELPSRAVWEAVPSDGGGSDIQDPHIMLRLHDHQLNFLPITAQMDLATAQKLHNDLGRMIASRLRTHGGTSKTSSHRQDAHVGSESPAETQAYPYYTTRGPRDFLQNNPPSTGK